MTSLLLCPLQNTQHLLFASSVNVCHPRVVYLLQPTRLLSKPATNHFVLALQIIGSVGTVISMGTRILSFLAVIVLGGAVVAGELRACIYIRICRFSGATAFPSNRKSAERYSG
jgi:hypothetical protein